MITSALTLSEKPAAEQLFFLADRHDVRDRDRGADDGERALCDIDAGDHALLRDMMSACIPNDLCHVARPQLPQEMIDPFAVIF